MIYMCGNIVPWYLAHLLFQLDSADEQAAQVRRELDGRLIRAEEMAKVNFAKLFWKEGVGREKLLFCAL